MNQKRRSEDKAVMSHRHILKAFIGYGTLVLAFGLLALVAFWLLYPYKIVTYKTTPFRIVETNKSAKQGGALSYEYDYTKYIDVPAEVSKQFIDGLIFQSEGPITRKLVGSGHVHSEIQIPETLPSGKYRLRIIATYRVNPIRTIVITNETEQFTVMTNGHPDAKADEVDMQAK
jgi:hypothetical protein